MAKTEQIAVRKGNTPTPAAGETRLYQQAGEKQHHTKNLPVREIDYSSGPKMGGGKPHTPSNIEERQEHGGFGLKPGKFPESHYEKGTKTTRDPDKHKPRVRDHE